MKSTPNNNLERELEVKTKSGISITQDGSLDIAIGKSRKEINWKNTKMLWSDLVVKLSETYTTPETYSDYLTSTKQEQDELKDVGGFLGGYLTNGKRSVNSVFHRQLITLDADFAHVNIWEDFTWLFTNTAVIYSTHKHSKETPRYRFVMPLDRPVSSDEYEAISRFIASNIGMDYFDPTTFQASRLMYWPSTSKDGLFEFNYQDGNWLNADEILSKYVNWKDSSAWAVCSTEKNFIQSVHKKINQEDPLKKVSIVGDFCRAYTIQEAIEAFLPDVYEPCEMRNRYTFKQGSTAGGLITYEDKFAFSHHGTDPISGKLCNAFDLVRLHKFGKTNEKESNNAMSEFAANDNKVKTLIGDKIENAKADFINTTDFVTPPNHQGNDWFSQMDIDRKGKVLDTTDNVVLILENDPVLYGKIVFDSFQNKAIVSTSLPWHIIRNEAEYYTDSDDACLRHYLEKIYGITNANKIRDAVTVILNKNTIHPVREYLNSLDWDGVHRVDNLLINYLGAENNEYVKAVTRKALVAAVARIKQPGIKFDYVLTLIGPQGIGKSALIHKLGGEWFSDSFTTVQGKEALEQLQGVWLVEMGELAGLRKAEVETIKHFISKREDRYRVAYGRRTESFPRQCVFFGTSNNNNFLRDPTGNRRFWPVDTMINKTSKNIFKDLTTEEIDQIWAEAVELYDQGEALYLNKELEEYAYAMQNEHSEQDERFGQIQAYLDTKVPEDWSSMDVFARRSFLLSDDDIKASGKRLRNQICVAEIWCELFGGLARDMDNNKTKPLHSIMKNMPGWSQAKKIKRFRLYGSQRAYIRDKNSVNTA